jgi:hypothetical protein
MSLNIRFMTDSNPTLSAITLKTIAKSQLAARRHRHRPDNVIAISSLGSEGKADKPHFAPFTSDLQSRALRTAEPNQNPKFPLIGMVGQSDYLNKS